MARVSDERCRHGGSVRIGSRFRNCFRTIHMRCSWHRFGGGQGDRLRRPLDVPLTDSAAPAGVKQITERWNMPRRSVWSVRQRAALFDLPTDEAALLRHYTLSDDDIEHVRVRRGGTTGWASRSSFAPFDIRGGFWRQGRPFP